MRPSNCPIGGLQQNEAFMKHWRRNDLYFGGGGLIQFHEQFMCSIIT